MYYEINVALQGRHFFATASRSVTNERELQIVFAAIQERFTKEQGYSISVTRHNQTITQLDTEKI